jgi:sphingosine kinase
MATDIVTKMDGGVGMQLLLEGKKKLTIGIDGLELNDPVAKKAGRSYCAPLTSSKDIYNEFE